MRRSRRGLLVLPWSLRHVGGVTQVMEQLGAGLRELPRWDAHLLATCRESAEDRLTALLMPTTFVELNGTLEGASALRAARSFA